jgi:hypothetical protein
MFAEAAPRMVQKPSSLGSKPIDAQWYGEKLKREAKASHAPDVH